MIANLVRQVMRHGNKNCTICMKILESRKKFHISDGFTEKDPVIPSSSNSDWFPGRIDDLVSRRAADFILWFSE
jgi:hypothetical protein